LAEQIGANRFKTWFGDSTQMQLDGSRLSLTVPNAFVGSWIASNFMPNLERAARGVLGADAQIDVRVAQRSVNGSGSGEHSRAAPGPDGAPAVARPQNRAGARRPVLRGELSTFVTGPANDLAYATACSVARAPGRAIKHLVLHAGCGLGKTHLLQGICNELSNTHPQLEWCYVSGEEFTNEFIYAVKFGRIDLFRARFRRVDVLVIDDLHFLANKKATQEEFLHTYNAIDAGGKTLVLSTDRHPRAIADLSEPLVDRLIAATVVQIDPPDFHTRREILRRRAASMQVEPAPEVLDFLARHITRNVRELEGALYKLAALAALAREPLGLDLARRALADLIREKPPLTDEIEQVAADYFSVSREAIRSKSRDRSVTLARGVAMYLIRRKTPMSFPEIGRACGRKNHSTVVMAVKRIQQTLDRNGAVVWKTSAGPKEAPLKDVLDSLERKLA
jgi:chromosomal replication initiator protein